MEKTNSNIEIRLINEIDLIENSREFIELLEDNYIINFPNHTDFSEYVKSNFDNMKIYTLNGSAYIVGAFLDNKVVGFLWAYKRVFLGEPRFHISHIIVNSKIRGHGLGTRLINYIENLATEEDIKVIELLTSSENKNTVSFYNKYGFNVTRFQFEKKLGKYNDNK